jgi:hypothetical protein
MLQYEPVLPVTTRQGNANAENAVPTASDLGVDTKSAFKNPRRPLHIQKGLSKQGTDNPRELVSHVYLLGLAMQAFASDAHH